MILRSDATGIFAGFLWVRSLVFVHLSCGLPEVLKRSTV